MSPRAKVWTAFAGIAVLTALAVLVDFPGGPDINLNKIKIPFERELKLRLGLDLQGGTHLVYEADLSRVEPANYDDAMGGVRDVIERRVNALGVSEPVVQTTRVGDNYRVIIELAGVRDVQEALDMIGQTPALDFRELASEEEVGGIPEGIHLEGEGEEARLVDAEGNSVDVEALSAQLEEQQVGLDGFKLTELTGQYLERADVQFDPQTNLPTVALEFDSEGKDLFAQITERNVGQPVGIYLDGEPISVPRVNEAITDGKAIISGSFTLDEAKELAMRLNAGALPVPISIVSQSTVGATLGQASVEKSFLAGVFGLILVSIFMIVYYRLPGVLSVVALAIYSLIVLALFKLIPVTMTLAGVAGFILSIGMAVDANVLIFERMKEELRAGKSLRASIEGGFKHAWASIRDSNVSSLITCFILAWFGTGIIKGFAITLGIGILVSMFSAITVTRTFLRLFSGRWLGDHLGLFVGGLDQVTSEKPVEKEITTGGENA